MSEGCKYFFVLTMLSSLYAQGQCPTTNFSIPTMGCINGNVQIANSSTIGDTYEWDFCSGDLSTISTPTEIFANTFLARSRSFKMVQSAGSWYGFAIDQVNNRLLRFDFGPSLTATPTMVNLGSLGNQLQNPYDFFLYQESNEWYALVANTATSNILKLWFGNNITAVPVTTNLGPLGVLNGPTGIFGVRENGSLFVFVASGSTQIVRIDFGNSINNTPTTTVYPVPISSGLQGISLIKECDRWFGLVTSYGNAKLLYLDFVSGIDQSPVIGEIASGLAFPATVTTALEGGTYYAFVQSAFPGNLYRVDFGSSIIDRTGTLTDLGNLSGTGSSADNFAFTFANQGSDWYGFFVDNAGSRLMRIPFASPCSATTPVSTSYLPIVSYTQAGIYKITQTVTDANGNLSSQAQSIAISSLVAPDIDFISQNICANHDVNFTSQNTSNNINLYAWKFGDSEISALQNPVHQYASAGDYITEVKVTATNFCENIVRKKTTIYNQPVADFTVPTASPLCTNQSFLFNNITTAIGYQPVWEWSIGGTAVATSEDLAYTFTSTANQAIKLKASIPGCETELTKNITTLIAGPKPDFTVVGQCEDADVAFANTSSGTVTGYSWNFDDGQTSTSVNPVNVFANPGVYDVVLTASNAAGCNNTASKQLKVYSVPQVNFMALAPPFSCTGTPTQFNDLTPPPGDSNLSSWLWDFGDSGSSTNTSAQKNPQHTYSTAADYTVSLTVTTNSPCSSTFQKSVTIYQTPTASFDHSALCEDTEVKFSDAASTNQAWNWQIGSSFYFTETLEHVFSNSGNYDVVFSVTGVNNCVGSTSQPIVIPNKLSVDFSTLRTCVNQEAEFTDVTNDSSDPITDVSWDFGGLGSALTTPATFTFPETGTVNVTLIVTTQSGCEFLVTKPIDITQGPLAAFTAIPNIGEGPLTVTFINTSLNANTFKWKFNSAGASSILSSPTFIYFDEGNYTVELVAKDLKSCVDTTRQLIEVLATSELNPPSPNPSTGAFTIEWQTNESTKTAIVLIDALGREIRHFNVMANPGINRYILNITGEQPGPYILIIRYLNTVKTYRLIVSE